MFLEGVTVVLLSWRKGNLSSGLLRSLLVVGRQWSSSDLEGVNWRPRRWSRWDWYLARSVSRWTARCVSIESCSWLVSST
jgi:hypothetical protein